MSCSTLAPVAGGALPFDRATLRPESWTHRTVKEPRRSAKRKGCSRLAGSAHNTQAGGCKQFCPIAVRPRSYPRWEGGMCRTGCVTLQIDIVIDRTDPSVPEARRFSAGFSVGGSTGCSSVGVPVVMCISQKSDVPLLHSPPRKSAVGFWCEAGMCPEAHVVIEMHLEMVIVEEADLTAISWPFL